MLNYLYENEFLFFAEIENILKINFGDNTISSKLTVHLQQNNIHLLYIQFTQTVENTFLEYRYVIQFVYERSFTWRL